MLFLLGVAGLDIEPFCEGGVGAVKDDDSGLFCNGIVVPGALPFDRGFGDDSEAFRLGLTFVLDVVDVDDGGGRCGDLGGEG